MSFVDIENAIQSAIKIGCGGITTIWARNNRPRPSRPFVSLETVSVAAVGEFVEHGSSFNSGTDSYTLKSKEHVEATIRVQVFSGDTDGDDSAVNIARGMCGYLKHEAAIEALDAYDIACVSVGDAQDISGVLASEFEGRAVVNLRFRYPHETAISAPYIGRADITTDIEGEEEEIQVVIP